MRNAFIIFQKDWLEMRQQPTLLLGIIMLPVIFTIMPLFTFSQAENISADTRADFVNVPLPVDIPSAASMQVSLATLLSMLYLILPGIITSIIASYSIVGEKTSRTLEPLLATPIRTWELLLGKCLASLVPGIVVTWLAAAGFIIGIAFLAVNTQVFFAIVSPGWLILILLWAPLLAIIAISVMIAISARANDPRTAQQASVWLVVPLLGLIFSQITGLQILGPVFIVAFTALFLVLAAASLWLATLIFNRESILTRWK